MDVAPYVGAWIETIYRLTVELQLKSHPTWVRGLKLAYQKIYSDFYRSHPTWVRGLKPLSFLKNVKGKMSHPTWVRGLKHK